MAYAGRARASTASIYARVRRHAHNTPERARASHVDTAFYAASPCRFLRFIALPTAYHARDTAFTTSGLPPLVPPRLSLISILSRRSRDRAFIFHDDARDGAMPKMAHISPRADMTMPRDMPTALLSGRRHQCKSPPMPPISALF